MEDEDRVGSGAICAEYRRQTGKAAQFSHTQISAWMRNGELDAIGAELGQNGRWSVIRAGSHCSSTWRRCCGHKPWGA